MHLPNGIYTIESPRGGHRTFRIRTQRPDAKFAPGARVAALLTGPDNGSDYTSFGFVGESAITCFSRHRAPPGKPRTPWEHYADMLTRQPLYEQLGYRYYLEKRCRVCNRRLTAPDSIAAEIGPECAGRGA